MTTALVFDIGLGIVVLVVASWTIAARETFAAVVGFVAYGLLLALVWVRLDALDVALTEAAIGSGLTGALLLGAAAHLRASETAGGDGTSWRDPALRGRGPLRDRHGRARGRDPVPARTRAHARAGGGRERRGHRSRQSGHQRADGLSRDGHHAGEGGAPARPGRCLVAGARSPLGRLPGAGHQADPHGVLAFLARLLPPLGIVVGIYILWTGADYPGGAFQGGAIIAAMWLLVMMAGLTDAPPVSRRSLRLMLIAGPAVFLAVGLGGLWLGDAFLAYPVAYAKPLILAIEFAMVLTVAVTLGLLVAGPPERSAAR